MNIVDPAFLFNSNSNLVSTIQCSITSNMFDSCLPNILLGWQPLIAPDRHVLSSIENSLQQTTDSIIILHSCKFFVDVLLQDFPAEIFLQRPTIVRNFHNLLNNGQSSTVTNSIVMALHKLTEQLYVRVKYSSDTSTRNRKQQVNNLITELIE